MVDFKFINKMLCNVIDNTLQMLSLSFWVRQMKLCDFLLTFLPFVLHLPTNFVLNESWSGHVWTALMPLLWSNHIKWYFQIKMNEVHQIRGMIFCRTHLYCMIFCKFQQVILFLKQTFYFVNFVKFDIW